MRIGGFACFAPEWTWDGSFGQCAFYRVGCNGSLGATMSYLQGVDALVQLLRVAESVRYDLSRGVGAAAVKRWLTRWITGSVVDVSGICFTCAEQR
jgi:hypothetical protein